MSPSPLKVWKKNQNSLGRRTKRPYSPVVQIFPHVLGQNHNQVIDVVVLVRRDPCGGKEEGVNQGTHHCWVKTQIRADLPC